MYIRTFAEYGKIRKVQMSNCSPNWGTNLMKKSRISSKQENLLRKSCQSFPHFPWKHEKLSYKVINTQTLNQQAQKFKQQFCQYHKIIGKSCAHLSTIKVQILVWIWLMMSVVQTHLRKKIVLIMSYIILIKYKTSVKQC